MADVDRIFLDLDGVLAVCHESALGYYGIPITLETWPLGQSTLEVIQSRISDFSLNDDAFWASFPGKFWAKLPKTPECDALVASCAQMVGEENVRIVSRPSRNPYSWSGKVTWIQENLPTWIHDQVTLTDDKWLLAGPNRLLIDDSYANCVKFAEAGGKSRWIQRPWNPPPPGSVIHPIPKGIILPPLTDPKS